MPRLNESGTWIAAGLSGGSVSVGRTADTMEVIATPAGGAVWLDDHRVAYNTGRGGGPWRLELYDVRTRTHSPLDPAGANDLVAGAGHWAARLDTPAGSVARGYLVPPDGAPLDIAPDGTLAYKPQHHGAGLVLRHEGGAKLELSAAPVAEVHVLGWGRATWTEADRPRAVGLLVPDVLDGPCWKLRTLVLRDGRQLALYGAPGVHGARLILQWADPGGFGTVVSETVAFRPDLRELADGAIRVVWSLGSEEQPGDIRERTVTVAAISELLAAAAPGSTPAPTPGPSPAPAPTPPPLPEIPVSKNIPAVTQAAIIKRIVELTREYPEAWERVHAHIDLFGRPRLPKSEAYRFGHLVAYDLSTRWPEIGLNGKRGNPADLSMDCFSWRWTADERDVSIIDYIINAGISEAYAAQLARGEGVPTVAWLREQAAHEPVFGRYADELERTGGIQHGAQFIGWGDVTEVSRPYGGGIYVKPTRPPEYRGGEPAPGPEPGPEPGPTPTPGPTPPPEPHVCPPCDLVHAREWPPFGETLAEAQGWMQQLHGRALTGPEHQLFHLLYILYVELADEARIAQQIEDWHG